MNKFLYNSIAERWIGPKTCMIYVYSDPHFGDAAISKMRFPHLTVEEADEYIFGYTIINDITARDFTLGDGQWTRGKSCDGFAPMGPYIETSLDPLNQNIITKVNGEVRQNSNTSQMIFSPQEIISYVSETMTLNPGDVIATGTPPGVGEMKADSIVEVTIEDIGTLKNYLIKEE